ncbi:MAG: L-seryl-tRNA(Sec) selenium transferase [Myxococcota bacterium]|nr:L-seryl-tRNA(Sec) selenium transferase [Myxococcota bacterium]
MTDLRSSLPRMDVFLTNELVSKYGHKRVVWHARKVLDEARCDAKKGHIHGVDVVRMRLARRLADRIQPAINGTGVLLHTNLGRAPWSETAKRRCLDAVGFSTVEFDTQRGGRGHRGETVEESLCALTGAEAALVVNNCAAAVFLMLSALARGRKILVSRGELVEIGGGFRIPDVMAASGAQLVEVGTTNRTHLRDFENAVDDEVAGVLKVHHSNFVQSGFVTQPTLKELGELDTHLLVDLGSGQLDFSETEPSVAECVRAGASVICMSGDKLLGGPQSGIIIGEEAAIRRLRRHPLYRAMRPDKSVLAALEGTLDDWLVGRAVPLQIMERLTIIEMTEWANAVVHLLSEAGLACDVIRTASTMGGGSLPGQTEPSVALRLAGDSPERVARLLRQTTPPVIGRIHDDAFFLDVRTMLPFHDAAEVADYLIERLKAGTE